MSGSVYLITRMEGRICSFLLQEGRAVEIHRDPDTGSKDKRAVSDENRPVLGNIYIGKVKNIAKQLDAAFVETAPGQVCYLALRDAKHPIFTKKGSSKNLQAGDELLVQVSREGIKSKYPSVTADITLHGKYVLLTTGNTTFSVSSKLDKAEKEKLAGWMREIDAQIQKAFRVNETSENEAEGDTREYGWLVRTNAGSAAQELLQHDALRLAGMYYDLIGQAQYRTCFSCLLRTPPQYLARLQNLYAAEAERILTDDEELFEEIREYLTQYQSEDLAKLELYRDHLLPMQKLYSLEKQLTSALSERVWLKSGGYLVIQPTEALVAIDVNTGKYEGGKNQEATFLKINKEAAAEIAHQLRLRNLSGIILVDFINMKHPDTNKELLHFLEEQLGRDPVQTTLVDMTKLSLVEITRMKREKPLAQE